jgi:hypothetical protein
MGLYQASTGDVLTAARWNTIYNLLKGVVGGEDSIKLGYNGAGALTCQPSPTPASVVKTFRLATAGGTITFAVRSDGALYLADQGAEVGSLEDGLIWRNGAKFYGRLGGATVELFTPPATPPISLVRLTADVSNSTVTLADITGLSFAVEANKDYFFEAELIFQTAATTTGISLAVNGPASPVSCTLTGLVSMATLARASWSYHYDNAMTTPDVFAANTNFPASMRGILRNGVTAGTLILRFASEVASSVVTIKAGSFIRWQQLN